MEQFNPFIKQIVAKQDQLTAEENKADFIQTEIKWNDNFDQMAAEKTISGLKTNINGTDQEEEKLRTQRAGLYSNLIDLENHKCPFWKVQIFFSSEQRSLRKKIKGIKKEVNSNQVNIKKCQDCRSEYLESIKAEDGRIFRFISFNKVEQEKELLSFQKLIATTEKDLLFLKHESKKLIEKLRPLLDELKQIEHKIAKLEMQIDKAKDFDSALSNASSKKEKAIIHGYCEDELGFSGPRQAVSSFDKQKQSVLRTKNKLEKRITDMSNRHIKPIRRLVFDGNNLCYCGQSFIGFTALRKLVNEASKKKPSMIIFDSGIRGLTQSSNQQIRKEFGSNIDIHIVSNKQAADETILKYSEDIEGAYVVTNDRFSDYPESKIVTENRMIRHEILLNMAFVHDLDISVKY